MSKSGSRIAFLAISVSICRNGNSVNLGLIGYCGSGKTSAGLKLSEQLWRTFIDIDSAVADKLRREQPGLPASAEPFQAAAKEATLLALKQLSDKDDLIVALPSDPKPFLAEIRSLKASMKIVFLQASPETLVNRLSRLEKENREPFLREIVSNPKFPQECTERIPIFESLADLTLDTGHLDIEAVVRLLIRMAC